MATCASHVGCAYGSVCPICPYQLRQFCPCNGIQVSGKTFNIGKGVSRRSFLKGTSLAGLTLAATGGLAGCSSVTQTGSMFTAPGVQKTGYQYASEAEEGTWHHCACQRNCFDTCMMKVRTVGGRVVEVRGDENSPYTADALIGTATAIDADDLRRPSEAGFYAFLKELGQSEDGDLRRTIASEYAELFVGPRPPLAPLYESVYLGSPSRLLPSRPCRCAVSTSVAAFPS